MNRSYEATSARRSRSSRGAPLAAPIVLALLGCASGGCGVFGEGDTPPEGQTDAEVSDTATRPDFEAFETDLVRTLPNEVVVRLRVAGQSAVQLGINPSELSMEVIPLTPELVPTPDDVVDLGGGTIVELGPDGGLGTALRLDFEVPVHLIAMDYRPVVVRYDDAEQLWRSVPCRWAEPAPDGRQVVTAYLRHFSKYGLFQAATRMDSFSVDLPTTSGGDLQLAAEGNFPKPLEATLNGPGRKWTWNIDAPAREWRATAPQLEAGRYMFTMKEGNWAFWEQQVQVAVALDPNSPELASLARMYSPILSFHERETYSPVALDESFFLPATIDVPYASRSRQEVSGRAAIDYLSTHGHINGLIEGDERGGVWASRRSPPNEVSTSRGYWVAQASGSRLFITYWYFYSHDRKDWHTFTLERFNHNRDREAMTVVLENWPDAPRPVGALYYGHLEDQTLRHRASGAEWTDSRVAVAWNEIDRVPTACTHPIAYVALGSHAMYPRRGRHELRFSFLGVSFSPEEEVGGSTYHCPTGVNDPVCLGRSTILSPLGSGASLADDDAWAHLAFSGNWVDVPGLQNARFPPYAGRIEGTYAWEYAFATRPSFGPAETAGCNEATLDAGVQEDAATDAGVRDGAAADGGVPSGDAGSPPDMGSVDAGQSADLNPPMGTITSPIPWQIVDGALPIMVSATDDVGLTSLEIIVRGAGSLIHRVNRSATGRALTWAPPAPDTSMWPEGVYSVELWASDRASAVLVASVPIIIQHSPTACVPMCHSRVCGTDGCGGVCAPDCPTSLTCSLGQCLRPPGVRPSVSAGDNITCALRNGRRDLYCWGNGQSTTWGGNYYQYHTNTAVSKERTRENAALHALDCLVGPTGQVDCPFPNRLAFPSGTATTAVARALQGSIQVEASRFHGCMRRSNGEMLCWGDNQTGALGDGSTRTSTVPLLVQGLRDIEDIAVSTQASCALRLSGEVWCWGSNTYGLLGDATSQASSIPRRVPGLAGIVDIEGGRENFCARSTGGSVYCWGRNSMGILGRPASLTATSTGAVRLPLSSSAEIAVGERFVCSRDAVGAVECLGGGRRTGSGTNAFVYGHTPVTIQGLPPVNELDASWNHICAGTATGGLWCWGDNQLGQLGVSSSGAWPVNGVLFGGPIAHPVGPVMGLPPP